LVFTTLSPGQLLGIIVAPLVYLTLYFKLAHAPSPPTSSPIMYPTSPIRLACPHRSARIATHLSLCGTNETVHYISRITDITLSGTHASLRDSHSRPKITVRFNRHPPQHSQSLLLTLPPHPPLLLILTYFRSSFPDILFNALHLTHHVCIDLIKEREECDDMFRGGPWIFRYGRAASRCGGVV